MRPGHVIPVFSWSPLTSDQHGISLCRTSADSFSFRVKPNGTIVFKSRRWELSEILRPARLTTVTFLPSLKWTLGSMKLLTWICRILCTNCNCCHTIGSLDNCKKKEFLPFLHVNLFLWNLQSITGNYWEKFPDSNKSSPTSDQNQHLKHISHGVTCSVCSHPLHRGQRFLRLLVNAGINPLSGFLLLDWVLLWPL